jgi:hypothetical protein
VAFFNGLCFPGLRLLAPQVGRKLQLHGHVVGGSSKDGARAGPAAAYSHSSWTAIQPVSCPCGST